MDNQTAKVIKNIVKLTNKISIRYPELYQFLQESPISINESANGTIETRIYKDYLHSLKELINHYKTGKFQKDHPNY